MVEGLSFVLFSTGACKDFFIRLIIDQTRPVQRLVMHILWDFWEENEVGLRRVGDDIHTTIFLSSK